MVNAVETLPKMSKESEDIIKDIAKIITDSGIPIPAFLEMPAFQKAFDEHFDEIFTDGPTKRTQKARDELIAQIERLSDSQFKRFLVLAEEQGILAREWEEDGYHWCIPPL